MGWEPPGLRGRKRGKSPHELRLAVSKSSKPSHLRNSADSAAGCFPSFPTTMKNRHDSSTETPEQLIEHINRLMAEAEAMIAGPVTDAAQGRLADLKDRLESARDKVTHAYKAARNGVVAGAKYTDTQIRQHPYQSLGIALGVGVLLGVLVGRSSANRY